MELWLKELLQSYGPTVAVIGFFIWRDYKREESQNKKNNDLEEFIRTTLVALVRDTMAVIQDNTTLGKKLNNLPCAFSSGPALDDRIKEHLAALGVAVSTPTRTVGASAAPTGSAGSA